VNNFLYFISLHSLHHLCWPPAL